MKLTKDKIKFLLKEEIKKTNRPLSEILREANIDIARFHQYMSDKNRSIKLEWLIKIARIIDLDLNYFFKKVDNTQQKGSTHA